MSDQIGVNTLLLAIFSATPLTSPTMSDVPMLLPGNDAEEHNNPEVSETNRGLTPRKVK